MTAPASTAATAASVPRERAARRARPRVSVGRIALLTFTGLVLLYLVFPVFIVAPLSFSSAKYLQFPPPGLSLQWYQSYFGRADWIAATWLSIRIGVITAVLATMLGTAAALALVRGRFPGKDAINSFIVSPLIIPTIIVAVGVYFFYARIHIIGSPFALALAHTALAIPFVVINVAATLEGFDERLEWAAMNLGANRWQTFFKITLPIIRPGVFAGALFAFSTSFDELIVALFVSGAGAVTLPRKMWESLRLDIDPTIAAVSTILIVISVTTLASAEALRLRSERMRTARVPDAARDAPGGAIQ